MTDAIFTPTLAEAFNHVGLPLPDDVEPGKIHRFSVNGKKQDAAGWLNVFPDGDGAVFGSWRDGSMFTWQRKKNGPPTNKADIATFKAKAEQARKQAAAEREAGYEQAAQKAAQMWQDAIQATEHPYLATKQIKSHCARISGENLLIPVLDGTGRLQSLQSISPTGEKRFMSGGKMAGGRCWIGKPTSAGPLLIAEGYATGASLHEATGYAVAVAFNAGNLDSVACSVRDGYPGAKLIIAGDDDRATEGNPGRTKAQAAATAVNAAVVFPEFSEPNGSDFNDMQAQLGGAAVSKVIQAAVDGLGQWPQPLPLGGVDFEREPYPLDALPDDIRAAVDEVKGFTQAPIEMVAISAIAAISSAAQGLADVKRAEKLTAPASVFTLVIAESGERKTAIDTLLFAPHRAYEAAQSLAMQPELDNYKANLQAWQAEKNGKLEAIKQASKGDKSTDSLKAQLRNIEADAPTAPKVPRILFGDITPESLAFNLAKSWPSSALVSSEAGTVFGSHAMTGDSTMRNLAILNVLWDGGQHTVDRRTSESFRVKNARLTVSLQIQYQTLAEFLNKSGDLARGSGFLARFMVAQPESTQGHRPYKEPPTAWPRLAAFQRRITELLNTPLAFDETGDGLVPQTLEFSPAGKQAWIKCFNLIEGQLNADGELSQLRDFASKAADNAARLAGLLHVYQHGPVGQISEADAVSGCKLALWHLTEARRVLAEFSQDPGITLACDLDRWLIKRCRRLQTNRIRTADVMRHYPSTKLRSKEKLEPVLEELSCADRAQIVQEGRKRLIEVNPFLLTKVA